jgi:hypothetical protein
MDALFLGLAIMAVGAGGNLPGIPREHSPAAPAVTQTFREAVVNPNDTPSLNLAVRPEHALARQRFQPPTFRPQHLKSRKAQAALMGAVAGLFGGAGIGYALTNGPDCDMCGLQGIVLGAPIGAVVGAIVAVRH